ncbi:hypothetical protein BIY23_02545 [Wolbachia pipientis]|uniref:Uncharacterized protein n=1 Tax=Wolbachia pipientis TaxID=955 RepID=A0A1E7QJS3_WOLPI|nr:hypothetical protein [Wolbachia pipientis]OEY86715.1 hypothetical protein BIY23_02545 [Wolbachia pipientis]
MIRNLIKHSTRVGNSENIIHYVEYLYQFEKFKNIFNLTLSLIKQDRLSFEVSPTTYSMEEGLCKTIQHSGMKRYIIVLKKLNPYIIVHELTHMVENELNLSLEEDFIHKVYQDMNQNFTQSNLLAQRLINQVIFKEIKAYDSVKSRASELFARFFELFAWAQEIYPQDKEYLIRTYDLDKIFFYTNQWKKSYLDPLIISKLDNATKIYSNKTPMQDVNKVRTQWGNKITPKNKRSSSIFED